MTPSHARDHEHGVWLLKFEMLNGPDPLDPESTPHEEQKHGHGCERKTAEIVDGDESRKDWTKFARISVARRRVWRGRLTTGFCEH